MEERTPSPVLRELQIGSGRQGRTVDSDERTTLDDGRTGVGVGLITQRPESTITRAGDRQGAGAREGIRVINEAEVDLVIAGGITAKVQRARTRAEEGDVAGVGEDKRGVVIRTAHDIITIGAVGLDIGVTGQGEEAVDRDGRRLGLLEDVDVTAVIVGLGRVAGIEQGTAIEDQRSGIGGSAGGVAATDRGNLADIGEGRDGQGAAADDGGSGVIVETGEGLRAAATLDDGELAGAVGEHAGVSAGTSACA